MNIQTKAQVILSSNAVFTGLADEPQPASIAIVNNKIAAIGSQEEMKPFIGENTQIFHFDNELILPGFHDFHLHIMSGALSMESVVLVEANSEEESVEIVRRYAEERPDEPWIIGFSWDSARWPGKKMPNRASLDRVISDRPVILFHNDVHYIWVNSKALERMNITRDTPNPPFGIIEKDEHGELTGILYESAIGLITKEAFEFSQEKKDRMMSRFLKLAARMGVTSVNDMHATESFEKLEAYELYHDFERNGHLTTRIHLLPALNGNLERVKQLRDRFQSGMLQFSGLKQFLDGVIGGHTAYILEPYSDKPGFCGEPAFPPDLVKKWVVEADREGFRIRFHAIGDGAVRLALDSFQEAQLQNGKRDSRHTIEHVEMIHQDDIPRFGELGVIASIQPNHMYLSDRETYTVAIGPDRSKHAWATKSLQEAGAFLAFSTDFPVDELNPMSQIYRAVTRIDNTDDQAWNPEQRVTLADALKAYTSGPAYGTFREHELGTLEVGKLADLVILDRNLFAVPTEEILEASVLMTIVDGKIVYRGI
ncbi:UNVERIFIED_CONTAM: putative amidohydrolase YtcJ [Brevibacillus sp. OAP136]